METQQAQTPHHHQINTAIAQGQGTQDGEGACARLVLRGMPAGRRGYRNSLSPHEQRAYDGMLDAMMRHEPLRTVHGRFTHENLLNAVSAVLSDHCEIFWVGDGLEAQHVSDYVMLSLHYAMLSEERERIQRNLTARLNVILARTIRPEMGDYERVLALHDWLCTNVTYTAGREMEPRDYRVDGALLHGECVCAGFSKAFTVLCRRAGVECWYVNGQVKSREDQPENQRHAWNIVRIDDWYQHVDVTFDAERTARYQQLSRRYVGLNDRKMRASRDFSDTLYPSCVLDQYNFERQGTDYFTTEAEVEEFLGTQSLAGERYIVVRMRLRDAQAVLRRALSRYFPGMQWFLAINRTQDLYRITVTDVLPANRLRLTRKGGVYVANQRIIIGRERNTVTQPVLGAEAASARRGGENRASLGAPEGTVVSPPNRTAAMPTTRPHIMIPSRGAPGNPPAVVYGDRPAETWPSVNQPAVRTADPGRADERTAAARLTLEHTNEELEQVQETLMQASEELARKQAAVLAVHAEVQTEAAALADTQARQAATVQQRTAAQQALSAAQQELAALTRQTDAVQQAITETEQENRTLAQAAEQQRQSVGDLRAEVQRLQAETAELETLLTKPRQERDNRLRLLAEAWQNATDGAQLLASDMAGTEISLRTARKAFPTEASLQAFEQSLHTMREQYAAFMTRYHLACDAITHRTDEQVKQGFQQKG